MCANQRSLLDISMNLMRLQQHPLYKYNHVLRNRVMHLTVLKGLKKKELLMAKGDDSNGGPDYQMQLMRLSQANKRRLAMAREEQGTIRCS